MSQMVSKEYGGMKLDSSYPTILPTFNIFTRPFLVLSTVTYSTMLSLSISVSVVNNRYLW